MEKHEKLIEYFKNGEWIDKLSEKESDLLIGFLRSSMAKQRKKVAFAEKISDGVLYVVYKVRYRKETNVLDLVVPGEVFIHKSNDSLPSTISDLPRVAFSTIFKLGEIDE
jgi:hypothetical protein